MDGLQLNLLVSLIPASNGAIILQKNGQVHTTFTSACYTSPAIMKRLFRPAIILLISLLIALTSVAVTYTGRIYGSNSSNTGAFSLQTFPTPPVEEDRSEVGSTDEIMVMGGVIVLIVLIPIFAGQRSVMHRD